MKTAPIYVAVFFPDIGGKLRFAVTTGVFIHPSYALASAEDMARIHPENLAYVQSSSSHRVGFTLMSMSCYKRKGTKGLKPFPPIVWFHL